MVNMLTEQPELCLEFANTVHWHASNHPWETLHSCADLLVWVRDQAGLTEHEAEQLARAAEQQPELAAAVFQRGIALREAIYRVFVAQIDRQKLAAADLARINSEVSAALAHAQIEAAADGFGWAWGMDTLPLERVLWPIARSAAQLLTSAELLARVGQCADDRGCGWLFLDMSKNHSRRWCDSNDCGNRAKQRRHYQRGKERSG